MAIHLWEEIVTIPTYPVGEANPYPPLHRSGYWAVYPYPLLEQLSDRAEPREYRAVLMENAYLRVMILPDLGGRVWSLFDRVAGRELLHQPPSIKPALIGLTGAWVAGGIEFNFPIGHRYTTHQPIWHALSYPTEEGGKATVWIGEVCRRSRMMWAVGISLYPDCALLETDIRLFNRSELKKRYYFWTNCAVSAHNAWKWILPSSAVRNWEGDLSAARAVLPFPISHDGVDLSLYRSYDRASSVFSHDFRGDFFGGYDLQADAGLLQVADWRVSKGRKLFTWGTSDDGQVWAERLDDNGIPYVEIQSGRFEDQSIWHWIPPHTMECWQEVWYPIRGLGGQVNAANRQGALSVQLLGKQLNVCCNVTSPRPNHRLIVQHDDTIVHEQRVDLYPEHPARWQFTLSHPATQGMTVIIATGARDTVLQATVGGPSEREEITIFPPTPPVDALEYFVSADTYERQGRTDDAKRFYEHAAFRHNYPPAYNALARLLIEEAQFQVASHLTRHVLATNPQDWEAAYLHALYLISCDKEDEAEEILYSLRRSAEYRNLAYYLQGLCAMRRHDYARADDLFAESLLYNAADVKAWMMRAIALRYRGELEEAAQVRLQVHELAPLEPLLRSEAFLSVKPTPDADPVNLLRPLAVQPWGLEEIACDYISAGCYEDAIRVLQTAERLGVVRQGMADYLLALAYSKLGMHAQAIILTRLVDICEPVTLFPWRYEDLKALANTLRYFPTDPVARYCIGLWYAAHDRPIDALIEWFHVLNADAVEELVPKDGDALMEFHKFKPRATWTQLVNRCLEGQERLKPPLQAAIYRNIGLLLSKRGKMHRASFQYYTKALQFLPDDPVLWLERENVARRVRESPQKTLQRLEKAPRRVLKDNRMAQHFADILVQNAQYDRALKVLHSRVFHVAEGETSTRPIWVAALVGKGKQLASRGRWRQALTYFQKALEYPRNLAVGKPALPTDAMPWFWAGLAYEKTAALDMAQACWQESLRCAAYTDTDRAYQRLAHLRLGQHQQKNPLPSDKKVEQLAEKILQEIASLP